MPNLVPVLLIAWSQLIGPGRAGVSQLGAQQASAQQVSTEHLEVSYPAAEAALADSFLAIAEGIYVCVDSLLSHALPPELRVELATEPASPPPDSAIVLRILHASLLGREFARELADAGARALVGATHAAGSYRFFEEGLATWVADRCAVSRGPAAPHWLWAAYAHVEEATYLEYLAAFERAADEMGKPVVSAAGYTLVDWVVESRGRDGLTALLAAMSGAVDLCAALDDAGFGCDAFLAEWWAALEVEVAKHDFSLIPQVHADLIVTGHGGFRDLSLWVRIVNPEAESYPFFVSLVIDGERSEEPFYAEASDYSGRVPLGQVRAGTKVMWDVAVWSTTLGLWRRSGWQNRNIE